MKATTRRRKQLETVSDWLKKARRQIQDEQLDHGAWQPEFSLLIAMEQLVKYLQMPEADK